MVRSAKAAERPLQYVGSASANFDWPYPGLGTPTGEAPRFLRSRLHEVAQVHLESMDDISDRLLHVFSELEDITSGTTPEEARGSLEEPTLQLFWRQWPQVSSWAGSLWRLLNEDTIDSAAPASDEFDEVGGSG